ncbi:MAG TPA: S41 family peptidase [Polyangiaceae bacterium]|nr:S41 family peptidase [Polyangiaceae bacterium]
MGRVLPILFGAAVVVFSGWWLQAQRSVDDPTELPRRAPRRPSAAPAAEALPSSEPALEEPPGALALPSGAPTRISCEDAQRVAAFLHRELAAPPVVPHARELAEVWGALLDPHGLWSAAPDSPLQTQLDAAAPGMLRSLHEQSSGCPDAERVAEVWQSWQLQLGAAYDAAYASARAEPAQALARVFELSAEPIFQDDPVTRPGLELARELGTRLGSFIARFPEQAALADQARARFLPTGKDLLREIAILAALRAYVPLVDPHGDFAPDDEEWALYAGDDTLDPGSALWRDVTRTALGARIVDGPTPPLQVDDLVLTIDGLSLAGASLDQVEQAARSADDGFEVRVLRQGESKLLTLRVAAAEPDPDVARLEFERIGYGAEQAVLRVIIPDVGDGLSEELSQVLQQQTPGTSAVLLDLRGNGGGSLDAAVDSLGLLLPEAPLFPLVHRGYVTEVLQAPHPAYVYSGPVAALVDGDTASAAEMLAGALQAYGRGSLVGARTFGKGCVQEYFDAVVDTGVLRMTTLQFVMPSGKPLQQIGLTPELLLPLAPPLERESEITRQPITFDGPDVRARKIGPGPAWPRASSPPGPCSDPVVCSAVSRLAGVRPGAPAAARATRQRAGTR